MAPHKKNQVSTVSSLSSRTSTSAPKPKPAGKAKKPVEAVPKPVKRLKTALSTSSLAPSQANSNDVPDNISDDGTPPDVVHLVSDDEEDPVDEMTPEEQLSTCRSPESTHPPDPFFQRQHRRLGVPRYILYMFFKSNISICYEGTRMYHFFPCAAWNCKSDAAGCRRFQDKADRASTSNLKAHAIGCFGDEAVKLAISAKEIESRSGSIFTAFARQGQKHVAYSHRAHTNTEVRAHIVKWVTENNQPASIVKDRELIELFCAGRPQLSVPNPVTVSRDIASAFTKCRVTEHLWDGQFTCNTKESC